MKYKVVWAKGLSQEEKTKMTGFTAGNFRSIYVSGVSVSVSDREDNLLINIMNCHGEDHKRYFTIPVDSVDDICNALQKAQKESLLKNNKVLVSNR